jgi:hypothetical protein
MEVELHSYMETRWSGWIHVPVTLPLGKVISMIQMGYCVGHGMILHKHL